MTSEVTTLLINQINETCDNFAKSLGGATPKRCPLSTTKLGFKWNLLHTDSSSCNKTSISTFAAAILRCCTTHKDVISKRFARRIAKQVLQPLDRATNGQYHVELKIAHLSIRALISDKRIEDLVFFTARTVMPSFSSYTNGFTEMSEQDLRVSFVLSLKEQLKGVHHKISVDEKDIDLVINSLIKIVPVSTAEAANRLVNWLHTTLKDEVFTAIHNSRRLSEPEKNMEPQLFQFQTLPFLEQELQFVPGGYRRLATPTDMWNLDGNTEAKFHKFISGKLENLTTYLRDLTVKDSFGREWFLFTARQVRELVKSCGFLLEEEVANTPEIVVQELNAFLESHVPASQANRETILLRLSGKFQARLHALNLVKETWQRRSDSSQHVPIETIIERVQQIRNTFIYSK